MCHREELGCWLIRALNLKSHMTSLWEFGWQGWGLGGRGRLRGVREGEVILGSRMEIQNTFVNHKQVFIT